MTAAPLRVLVAPDSFKGTLSSVEVASAIAAGWLRARPDDEIRLAPLADGGEGTIVAIEAAGGWSRRLASVHGPLGWPARAAWLARVDESAAVVEMAQASGLSMVAPQARDAWSATSVGTGEVLRAVLDQGIRDIVLGIGGSATTDGGAGLLRGLGATVDEDLTRVDLENLEPRLIEVSLRVASDVTNPLLGPTGAAAVYGPQKGATPELVERLDARLSGFADALSAATHRDERETPGAGAAGGVGFADALSAATHRDERKTPGAGAAGGVGFALLSIATRFRSLLLVPGVDLVMAAAGFDEALASADVVITGEGRIDEQTAYGKTAMGVARRAQAAGVRCIALGGGVTPEGMAALAAVGAEAVAAHATPIALDEALALGSAPIEARSEWVAARLD